MLWTLHVFALDARRWTLDCSCSGGWTLNAGLLLLWTLDPGPWTAFVEEKLRRCLREMASAGVKRVALYGASDAARILFGMVDGDGVTVVGVVDDAHGAGVFNGMPVVRSWELRDLAWDGVLITTLEDFEGAEARLRALGVSQEAIWKLS